MTEGVQKPLVAKSSSNRGLWFGLGAILLLAILLFSILEGARLERAQPGEAALVEAPLDIDAASSIPRLDVPALPELEGEVTRQGEIIEPDRPTVPAAPQRPRTAEVVRPSAIERAPPPVYRPPPPPLYNPVDTSAPPPTADQQRPEAPDRIFADLLRNPSMTVTQGTLISAVLESALDSTRPGEARALVTKDVLSFDGERVLIPRGSRIFGDYQAELEPGQRRLLIRWDRLLTPAGVSVNLNSPSADTLGRAGVRGKVDNHTWQRIGDALLGSVVELGAIVAGQEIGASPVIILPGGSETVNVSRSDRIKPTLKVAQGTRVTVFVATDLDFSTVM